MKETPIRIESKNDSDIRELGERRQKLRNKANKSQQEMVEYAATKKTVK